MVRVLVMAVLGLAWVPCAAGHDFWIVPELFRPAAQARIAVRLFLGDDFQGELVPRRGAHMKRFFARGPSGTTQVRGLEGMNPAGYLQVQGPGLHVIGYESMPNYVELPAETFASYLEEEGLTHIARLRAERGQSASPGRESYARYAKSLIWVGPPSGPPPDASLGLPIEILVETNPYLATDRRTLTFRVNFQGSPLANAVVRAMAQNAPHASVSGRTDGEGRVRLELATPGVWLVKSVHMVPAAADVEGDWTSYWASLTFERSRDGFRAPAQKKLSFKATPAKNPSRRRSSSPAPPTKR